MFVKPLKNYIYILTLLPSNLISNCLPKRHKNVYPQKPVFECIIALFVITIDFKKLNVPQPSNG